jgi:hypothetical protein
MAFSSVLPPMYLVGVTTTRVNARHVMTGVLLGWAATIVMIVWYTMTRGTDHSVSFLWTSVAGSVVMTIWCYIPVILRFKQVDSNKTDGLTLWTLGKGLPVNDESKSVERIVSV